VKKVNSIKDIVQNEVKNSKIFKENTLYSNWKIIAGDNLAKKTYPMYIKDRKLTVVVENSAWLQQMNFIKKQLIENINDFLGGVLVEEIYFKIGKNRRTKIESSEYKDKNKIDTSDIILSGEDILSIKESIKEIENIELKEKMYKLISKNRKREIYLLKNGYKACRNCGTLFNLESDICELCLMKINHNLRVRVIRLLKKYPRIKFIDAKHKINELTIRIYDEEKEKLCSKCVEKIKKEKSYDKNFEAAKLYLNLKNRKINSSNEKKSIDCFLKSFT